MTLQDLENRVYAYLREPEYLDPAGGRAAPPTSSQFPLTLVDADLNIALQIFLDRTGFAPDLSDKLVTLAIVAGLDYALPADLASLDRVEYKVGVTGYSYRLQPMTFDEFDSITGGGVYDSSTGPPQVYRLPYGVLGTFKIRLYPQPTAGNVTAGDLITLYYTSNGTALVAPTDVPAFPAQYHEALACYVLSRYWRIKNDFDQANAYRADFNEHIKNAKTFSDNVNSARQPSFESDEDELTGSSLFGSY